MTTGPLHEKALRILQRNFGEDAAQTAIALASLARFEQAHGRLEPAHADGNSAMHRRAKLAAARLYRSARLVTGDCGLKRTKDDPPPERNAKNKQPAGIARNRDSESNMDICFCQ